MTRYRRGLWLVLGLLFVFFFIWLFIPNAEKDSAKEKSRKDRLSETTQEPFGTSQGFDYNKLKVSRANVIADYKEWAKYPPNSRPLSSGHTARTQYWWIPKRPIKLPYVKDGKLLEPLHQCLLQPKEKHIMEGESVEFFLVCSRLGKGSSTDSPENQDSSPYAPIVIKRLEFYRYFSPNKYPLPLPEVIPGTQENNYIHTFRYRPRQEDWGRLKLVAHFSIPEGNEKPSYSLLASVFSSPEAPARFTGFQGEAIVNGSLVIRVGLNVKIPARYTIEANLYAGKSPVAYAKKDSQLKQGAQQIKLLFFGKIFHEAGHPGPYRIVGLRGTQHNSALNTEVLRRPPKEVQKYLQNLKSVEPNKRIIPSYEKEYLTDSYELDEFSPKEWDSPRKRRRLNDLNKIRD